VATGQRSERSKLKVGLFDWIWLIIFKRIFFSLSLANNYSFNFLDIRI
jgi:hypothetical protein